ncbi:MAG: ImmA/IrrE family metallo-endopeptidase [Turicibacter sp.]|nr:ImmA/IrrE family metallo-endopeptidase [Turicibacter sp.]
MYSYMAEPKSHQELRHYATQIRCKFNLEKELFFPIVEFLEIMVNFSPNFCYDIFEDNEMAENIHADTDVVNHCIRIKRSVYEGACNGNGRDRMTIAHEIGHYLMISISGFKLQRSFGATLKPYEDPEWQAKCFAGELLVPAHLISGMDEHEIAIKCGVSLSAACVQKKHVQ